MTDFQRAANRVLQMIGKFKSQLTKRDVLMIQIGMRASHIEEALALGDTWRAQVHVNKLSELVEGLKTVK